MPFGGIGEFDQPFTVTMAIIEVSICASCLAAIYIIGIPIAKRQRALEEQKWELEEMQDEEFEERRLRRSSKQSKPAAVPPPLPAELAKLRFACAGCGSRIEIAASHAGRKVRCPNCASIQVAPGDAPADGITTRRRLDKE
jgi:hypothetical protein